MPRSPSTAVAVAETEEHPIVAAIDAKMPQIAQMLPAGLDAERFRRVAIQALVKNPDLWQCTPISIVTAIVEAAQLGLEPTGLLGGAFLVPYNVNVGNRDNPRYEKRAQLIVGYRGLAELAWRTDQMRIEARVVHRGDEFAYAFGTDPFIRHIPQMVDPGEVTHVYAVASLRGGGRQFEVMSLEQVEAIRDRARHRNPVWDSDFEEMARKTAVRRLVKYLPLSPQIRDRLSAEDDISYDDAPVMRVAAPPKDRRAAIAARRQAALPGPAPDQAGAPEAATEAANRPEPPPSNEQVGASEEAASPPGGNDPKPPPSTQDTVLDVDYIPFDQGPVSGESAGDPWMKRLHAVGSERGLDHDAIHALAVAKYGVESLTGLTTIQRAQLMVEVEDIEPAGTPDESAGKAGSDPSGEGSPSTEQVTVVSSPPGDSVTAGEAGVTSGLLQDESVEPGRSESATASGDRPVEPAPPAPSVGTPLGIPAFSVFAAAVLNIDTTAGWDLSELNTEELEHVVTTMAVDDYDRWFKACSRELRAVLRNQQMSPRQRADRAIAAEAKERLAAAAVGATT